MHPIRLVPDSTVDLPTTIREHGTVTKILVPERDYEKVVGLLPDLIREALATKDK